MMDVFKLKYQEFVKTRFPTGLAGEEINGIALILLDADIAGLLQKYFSNKGRLTGSDTKLLISLHKDLDSVLSELKGVPQKYFMNLFILTNEVIINLNQGKKHKWK